MKRFATFISLTLFLALAAGQANSQSDYVTNIQLERYLEQLGYFKGNEDVVDGRIDSPTWSAIARFEKDHGLKPLGGYNDTPERRSQIRDAALASQKKTGGTDRMMQMAKVPMPDPGAHLNFNSVQTRHGITVAVATRYDCSAEADPYRIISDDPESLSIEGDVANTLANIQPSLDCMRSGRAFYTVPVYTSAGKHTGKAFLFSRQAPRYTFPYDILTVDMVKWLKNDPGLPLARIAPDFINLISGQWHNIHYHIGGPTQMKSILFRFALADASLCPDVVGDTRTYKLTRSGTDAAGFDYKDETEFKFDADWNDIMLKILEEGNHLGARLGTFSRELIGFYGCTSPQINMMRDDLIAFGRLAYKQ